MCLGMCVGMCIAICLYRCIEILIDMQVDLRVDLCIDMNAEDLQWTFLFDVDVTVKCTGSDPCVCRHAKERICAYAHMRIDTHAERNSKAPPQSEDSAQL